MIERAKYKLLDELERFKVKPYNELYNEPCEIKMTVEEAANILANMELKFEPLSPKERKAATILKEYQCKSHNMTIRQAMHIALNMDDFPNATTDEEQIAVDLLNLYCIYHGHTKINVNKAQGTITLC